MFRANASIQIYTMIMFHRISGASEIILGSGAILVGLIFSVSFPLEWGLIWHDGGKSLSLAIVSFALSWSGLLLIRGWYKNSIVNSHNIISLKEESGTSKRLPQVRRQQWRSASRGSACPKPVLPKGSIHVVETGTQPRVISRSALPSASTCKIPVGKGLSLLDISTDYVMTPAGVVDESFEMLSPINNRLNSDPMSVPDSIAAIWEPWRKGGQQSHLPVWGGSNVALSRH